MEELLMEGIEQEEGLHCQLKRKLYQADFESVESLKGLELEDSQPSCRHGYKRRESENENEKVRVIRALNLTRQNKLK